ncbi:MAG: enoyl-CoA hydratase/isomerase family protein [Candidatus Margulisbacteria bacterium]|nr:enoyl-CoA hydratase/isomerase family protein [Candidatus Margulisiibacteriota bacterium]
MAAFKFSVVDSIAHVVFDLEGEKVNKLSTPVMQELDKLLDKINASSDINAVIISSAKPGIFIAGADIKEIEGITMPAEGEAKAKEGHKVFFKLENLKPLTIAAIDGACLGGGLELALACDFRIVTDHPKTTIGAPEVNLGILPGFGGTQRLPKLIGLQQGLGLILSGKPVDGKKALKIGLADKMVHSEFLPEKALEFTREILSYKGRKKVLAKRKPKGLAAVLFEKNPLGRMLVYHLAKQNILKQSKGFYPAPLKALQAIQAGFRTYGTKGYAVEARLLGELAVTEISKNLIQIFYTSEDLKKFPGVAGSTLKPKAMHKAGLLGAGFMGGGIAQLLAYKDISVRMKDINWQAIAAALKTAADLFKPLVKRRRLKPQQAALKMGAISGTVDYSGFKNVDLVIEAVIEDMGIKKKVFQEVSEKVNPEAVLMSNTSSLSITEMASASKHPDKVIGFHFFSPVHRMPLIEVIPGKQTSEQTIIDTVGFAKALGKTPVVVNEGPGFLVNRVLFPYLNEAAHLVEEGIPLDVIDKAAAKFGMPIGPLTLIDEIGIPVCYKVAKILETEFKDAPRAKTAKVLEKIHDLKLTGKKSKAGLFLYKKKKKKMPNPAITKGIVLKSLKEISISEITERMILIMINEAAACIESNIIKNPKYLDMAMVMGTGFPPFRGGLLKYADKIGLKEIVEKLDYYAKKYGERFAPVNLLKDMAKDGKYFYER